ncbi:MAG TPA: 23S rRNA (adenine(1618)-N(6))-methyltransferase RlmF [Bacteroidales bacterium]|nr:23S rRNA (adenine(1618)-N(6))-methyltransferase RlmF [Bacteroidales bacterium]HQI46103.1 23S rRNA (adenine(1618)-N(6))-methyltransferase RlmF [Bacteroidales bacterium]
MLPKKKEHPKEKSKLHPRNKHRERYDFKQLIESCADLTPFVKLNLYNDESIDFANPEAVRMLNKALLKHYYNIENWNIPANYLCPPIPGRADYIHYMADLVCGSNYGNMPAGEKIKCLDVGVGANCVYPIIGMKEYGWSFVGSDIDTIAIESANKIIESNSFLKDKIEIRLQNNPKDIFYGIIQKEELFDLTICNPPFNKSAEESKQGTLRKLNNLNDSEITKPILNFGGKSNELWCKGGELKFVKNMVYQSKQFATSCFWFSTIISKQSHLSSVYEVLKKMEATEVKTISMGQGNKSSRIVAWTFFMPEQKKQWVNTRWKDEH